MKKITALLLLIAIAMVSGCGNMKKTQIPFQNAYELPARLPSYSRIDVTPKTDWTASYIWDDSAGDEENVWMCFRKTFDLQRVPKELTACISADSKYWLWINGELAVFEGGVKRGPTPDGSYYDPVPIGSYLKPGKNVIAALVWYWGKDTSYSNTDSGKAGFLFEAGALISDESWRICRHPAYGNDPGTQQPNYRLPESNIYYDARLDPGDWTAPDFDDGAWANATESGVGGCAPWGTLYPRGIPMLRDYGLKDYVNSAEYENRRFTFKKKLTLDIPYNAQVTPYLRVDAPAGKTIRITTENTGIGAVNDTYITREGEQAFEALGWFNGEHITYEIPAGVTVLSLQYRETGYDTAFAGSFTCENVALNTLWQKSLRTLYVTMRDNFMDCPDRERAQWWGDVTNEMTLSMYALDPDALLLYQKGVAAMLGHVDPETNVLQTVVPISRDFFELPAQQLAGICGFWTYYLYTGDRDFLETVYGPALAYVRLWQLGDDGLVVHRPGSWDWMDWGLAADVPAIENAWYYYALSCLQKIAGALGRTDGDVAERMDRIRTGYASLWTEKGYKSDGVLNPDDRANALAVLAGLATEEQYDIITNVLTTTINSSPYMEYYVLEALCGMARFDEAKARMLDRYDLMIREDYSTLWELWIKPAGTMNHAWSGGPLVIMSKYFAGIRPAAPGWETCRIAPRTDLCETISCAVPTVKGYIRLQTEKTDGGISMVLSLPANVAAEVSVLYEDGQTLTLDGGAIYANGRFTAAQGLTFVEQKDGRIVFTVPAGAARDLRFETLS